MLFRRRKPETFWSRMRVALWPRRSFGRSLQYFAKRVMRLTATPHAIAAGVAAGVFASWTPLLGFHFVLAAALAFLLAGNMVASAIGTAFGNPITFPFIWGVTHKTGSFILGSHEHAVRGKLRLGRLFKDLEFSQLWDPILKPMLVGAVPFGLFTAMVFYGLTFWSVRAFQNRRRQKMYGNS